MRLFKAFFVLATWGIVVWMAATFGLSAGLAAIAIIICCAIIETADEWIEKENNS